MLKKVVKNLAQECGVSIRARSTVFEAVIDKPHQEKFMQKLACINTLHSDIVSASCIVNKTDTVFYIAKVVNGDISGCRVKVVRKVKLTSLLKQVYPKHAQPCNGNFNQAFFSSFGSEFTLRGSNKDIYTPKYKQTGDLTSRVKNLLYVCSGHEYGYMLLPLCKAYNHTLYAVFKLDTENYSVYRLFKIMLP